MSTIDFDSEKLLIEFEYLKETERKITDRTRISVLCYRARRIALHRIERMQWCVGVDQSVLIRTCSQQNQTNRLAWRSVIQSHNNNIFIQCNALHCTSTYYVDKC